MASAHALIHKPFPFNRFNASGAERMELRSGVLNAEEYYVKNCDDATFAAAVV